MPTDPVEEMHPLHTANPLLDNILANFAAPIDELVNFGTHVIRECASLPAGIELLGPLMLGRHALELLDAISCLIRKGLADPCKPLLRCLFEASLGIQHILQKDAIRRSRALYVQHARNQARLLRQWDLRLEQGKQFKATRERDRLLSDWTFELFPRHREFLAAIEEILDKGEFADVGSALAELKRRGSKNPEWYELFDGPRNVQGLAVALGLPAFYEIMYRYWSGFTHGSDTLSGRIADDAGRAAVVQIRFPESAQEVTFFALTLGTDLLSIIVEKLIPQWKSRFGDWFAIEMRGAIVSLAGAPRIIIRQ